MKILKYKAIGTAPLLMHSDKTANPLNSYTKKLKEFTGKRNKTDDDHLAIAEIEFEASLYWNERQGYFIPSANIEATLLASAKHFKLGQLWKQAAVVINDAPLIFRHSKLPPAELFKLPQYVDIRTVKVQASKNMRCRPIFHEWNFEFEVMLDEGKLNESQVDQVIKNAGSYIGIADWRPKFGRFEVEKL
jgi:hypothetical protein